MNVSSNFLALCLQFIQKLLDISSIEGSSSIFVTIFASVDIREGGLHHSTHIKQ